MDFAPRLIACLLGAVVLTAPAHAKDYRVTVAAANVERAAQVVTFKVPTDAPKPAMLKGADGHAVPLQLAADGTAAFIVTRQPAGAALSFLLASGAPAPEAKGVEVKSEPGHLHVTVGGAPVFDYQMDKEALPRPDIKPEFKRAGYLHPIFTPAGKIVSDDYPRQHVHHHGIWTPWTKTSFQGRAPDFWNMGQKTGTVEFVALDWTWSGPVHGGFVAQHRFVDLSAPQPVTALHEVWQVSAYNVAEARVFDLILTQVCATNDPLVLPTYHYGGLGFRGRGEWLGKDKAHFLTSEGETDRVKANAQRMRWVQLSGELEGDTIGLAVLGHPDNFRAPQPVRVHPNEPYVSFTPSQAGEWKIEPGKPYVARYRFVATDGAPDRVRLDAYWNGFATSASVTVEPVP
jgi:hypothetical protein